MGKHGAEYARVERDLYPTPAWVIDALAEHVELTGMTVWEPACGDGGMARALRAHGANVFASDVATHTKHLHSVADFLDPRPGSLRPRCDMIITNPPFGPRGTLAVAFIETGLVRLTHEGQALALLLPCDFDSARTRSHLFGDCPHFAAKIVLTKRIVWFGRNDGVREAPKENHAWFLWQRSPLRLRHAPVILYAPVKAAAELPYDAADDFSGAIDDCYAAIRDRVAAGGKTWKPK